MLQRQPDDLVAWTFSRQKITGLRMLMLDHELVIGRGAMQLDEVVGIREFVAS